MKLRHGDISTGFECPNDLEPAPYQDLWRCPACRWHIDGLALYQLTR